MSDYISTVQSARTAIPIAVEMEELFPMTDHFITHFGFDNKPKTWNSKCYFGGRYQLTMQVEVDIDYAHHTVRQIGDPSFFVVEVEKLESLGDGRVAVFIDRDMRFDLDKWKTIVKSKGGLDAIGSALGIQMNPKEVPLFSQAVAAERKDIVKVQLRAPQK